MPTRSGEILQRFEGKDLARRLAVVGENEFVEFKIVDGQTLRVCCVEGEQNFIDRDTESIGCRGLIGRGLRIDVVRVCEKHESDNAAEDLGLTNRAHVL